MLPLDGHVIGVALLRPLWCSSLMRYLTEAQQALRQYWNQTKYATHQFVYVQVVAAESLSAPLPVRASIVRSSSVACFFEITNFSAQRVWEHRLLHGLTTQELISRWRNQYGFEEISPLRTCLSMSAPHGTLVVSRALVTYAFPYATGRSGSAIGMSLAAVLTRGLYKFRGR